MMTQALFVTLAVLFALKLGWNFGLPYWLGLKAYFDVTRSPPGVSIVPGVETVLLLCMAVTVTAGHDAWGLTPTTVTLIGAAVIFGSYVHLFLASFVLRWLVGVIHRRRGSDR